MSTFDDLDEVGPSNPAYDSSSTTDVANTEPGTSALLMVRSCSRIGLQASPPGGLSGWFWRR